MKPAVPFGAGARAAESAITIAKAITPMETFVVISWYLANARSAGLQAC
jgi:hypothetical protein